MTSNSTETRALLGSARCGVPDVAREFRTRRAVRVRRYNLQGQRWTHSNLTWSLRGLGPAHLTRDIARRELSNALAVWARHTLLTFTETFDDPAADIQVYFHRNYHGGKDLFKSQKKF